MSRKYTLMHKDFSNLHNAKCYLNSLVESIDGVAGSSVVDKLKEIQALLNKGMADVNEQEARDFDARMEHYRKVQEANRFMSVWSIFDVDNVFDLSGMQGREMAYQGKVVPLPGGTLQWWDLWRAAERLIKESGDSHHVFIETFVPRKNNPNILELVTGS